MSDTGVPTPAALRPPGLASTSDPSRFGRVDADGTVVLIAPAGEIVVGQWAAGEPAAGLAFFGRKYDDLVVEIDLIEKRLADHRAPVEQAETVLARVREALAAPSFVGDVAGLEARCDRLDLAVAAAKDAARLRKAEQREAALVARRALAEEAESLRDSTSWRTTTERFAAIVDEWKALPRGDRGSEQEMWHRISSARTAFDKRRRTHFADVDAERKVAVSRKRELIAIAETLATSTDWSRTAKQLRDLLTEWKDAPRGSRADEDRLWKRFKAAQDAFYAARSASEEAEEDGLRANVPAKEALADEAERLLPITDLKAVKASLRSIQDRWDKVGDLPRSDRDRVEGRLKRVEEAIRKAESDNWSASTGGLATNAFTEALGRLQEKRDAALARGDAATAAKIDAQMASTRALMGR
jgi:hypothetical protein